MLVLLTPALCSFALTVLEACSCLIVMLRVEMRGCIAAPRLKPASPVIREAILCVCVVVQSVL